MDKGVEETEEAYLDGYGGLDPTVLVAPPADLARTRRLGQISRKTMARGELEGV